MITHVVLLSRKPDIGGEQLRQLELGFAELAATVPDIAEFADDASFRACVAHPPHQAFLKRTAPMLDSFRAAQF